MGYNTEESETHLEGAPNPCPTPPIASSPRHGEWKAPKAITLLFKCRRYKQSIAPAQHNKYAYKACDTGRPSAPPHSLANKGPSEHLRSRTKSKSSRAPGDSGAANDHGSGSVGRRGAIGAPGGGDGGVCGAAVLHATRVRRLHPAPLPGSQAREGRRTRGRGPLAEPRPKPRPGVAKRTRWRSCRPHRADL